MSLAIYRMVLLRGDSFVDFAHLSELILMIFAIIKQIQNVFDNRMKHLLLKKSQTIVSNYYYAIYMRGILQWR